MSFYIGIMSGTSLDGIDVVIVDLQKSNIKLIAHSTTPYKDTTKQQIDIAVNAQTFSLDQLCQLDRQIAKEYTSAVLTLLRLNNIQPDKITAIGCHGQTIKHNPKINNGYTLQIGDPNTLAALCNITVVADFRRKDVALGGDGAPLAPAFHQFAFQDEHKNRGIINIGGIANITMLPKRSSVDKTIGFDTGPGNTLIDHYCAEYFNQPYDKNGNIAKSGHADLDLIDFILNNEPYFSNPTPKSTGTDAFNLDWFSAFLSKTDKNISKKDQLATLTELSAVSIAQSIQKLPISLDEIYYCGGGQSNAYLMQRLQILTQLESRSTEQLNLHPDWVEAVAFAWFAKNTIKHKESTLASVTSANKTSILGGIFYA